MKKLDPILSKTYIDFLKANKIDIGNRNEFKTEDCFFSIKKFYNLSDGTELIKLSKKYEGRFDAGCFIIADVENGDYLLMNQKGNILFWNHERNDLGYNNQAESPLLLSQDITSFLDMLSKRSDIDLKPDVKSVRLSDNFHDLFKDYLE